MDTTYNSPVITMSTSQTILLTQSQYYKTKVSAHSLGKVLRTANKICDPAFKTRTYSLT